MIKDDTSEEDEMCRFHLLFRSQIELTIQKDQLSTSIRLMMNNARIHRKNKVTEFINLIIFYFLPYSTELNKVEINLTFWRKSYHLKKLSI